MPRRNRDDAQALDAFLAAKAEIDVLLDRLARLSDDHFGIGPEEVDWGHVGTLGRYQARLREIADTAFGEGEHAA